MSRYAIDDEEEVPSSLFTSPFMPPKEFGKKNKRTPSFSERSAVDAIKPQWEDGGSRGSAILFKMGYRGGGLGKDGKGMAKPIQTKLRPNGVGLGYNNFKEQTKETIVDFDGSLKEKIGEDGYISLEEEEEEEDKGPNSWTAKQNRKRTKKRKTLYKTMEEITEQAGRKETIIDMRDGTERIYNPAIREATKPISRGDMLRIEIENMARKVHRKEQNVKSLDMQQRKIERTAKKVAQRVEHIETISALLQSANKKLATNSFSLDSVMTLFQMLQAKFPQEFEFLNVSHLMAPMIFPLFQRLISVTDPFEGSDKLLHLVLQWKELFFNGEDVLQASKESQAIYYSLIDDLLVPRIRRCLTNQWKIENSSTIVNSLQQWEPFFSDKSFQNIVQQSVVPKIESSLRAWEPKKDFSPNEFFLPWLIAYPVHFSTLFTTVRQKFTKILEQIDPYRKDIHDILRDWYPVLRGHHFDHLVRRTLLPNIRNKFTRFSVNPTDQELDGFRGVIQWRDLIPLDDLIPLFDELFFPQFLKVLEIWLANAPNYKHIHDWYVGWKKEFPPMFQEQPRIYISFHEALLMISKNL